MPGDTTPSDLQIKLAREVINLAVEGKLSEGDHLREVDLSERFGVSRTPMRATLNFLVESGMAEKRTNRGFFWSGTKSQCRSFLNKLPRTDEEVLCEKIAKDWFDGRIDREVSEALVRKKYELGRLTAQRILTKLSDQGVVSRMPGYGWQFEPTLNTSAAHDESYDFRTVIESSAILSDAFVYRRQAGDEMKHRHESALKRGASKRNLVELFRLDADFHNFIAECSSNRFVVQAIQHQNRLRRLLEYNSLIDAGRMKESCEEHIAILESLEAGDQEEAAVRMREHLQKARAAGPEFEI